MHQNSAGIQIKKILKKMTVLLHFVLHKGSWAEDKKSLCNLFKASLCQQTGNSMAALHTHSLTYC